MATPIVIETTVKNQKLKLETNIKSLVAGATDTVYFKFDLGPEWSGLITYAKFTQNEEDHIYLLDDNNEVMFPGPILEEGFCELTLHGAAQNNEGFKIATTNCLYLKIEEDRTLGKEGGPSAEIKDAWDELLRRINIEVKELSALATAPYATSLEVDYLGTVIRPYSVFENERFKDTPNKDDRYITIPSAKRFGNNLGNKSQGAPSEPQGITYIKTDEDGNDYVLVFYAGSYDSLDGWAPEGDDILVNEFKFSPDHTSSEIIRQQYVPGLYHCNGAGFDGTYVYTASCGYKNTPNEAQQVPNSDSAIKKLKYNIDMTSTSIFTDSIESITINPASKASMLAYNRKQGSLNTGLYCMSGKGNNYTIYRVETSSGKTTLIKLFEAPAVPGADYKYISSTQGLAVCGNYVYISTHKPNCILVYDCTNMVEGDSSSVKCRKIYNVPAKDEYGHMLLYVEDLDCNPDTGDFYINIWAGINKDYYGGTNHKRACYVYKFNLQKGAYSAARTPLPGIAASTDTIYVSNMPVHINCIYQKGTATYPFTTLGEAFYAFEGTKDARILRVVSRPKEGDGENDFDGVWNEHIKTWGRDILILSYEATDGYDGKASENCKNGTLRFWGIECLDGKYRFQGNFVLTGQHQYGEVFRSYNSIIQFDGAQASNESANPNNNDCLTIGKSKQPSNVTDLKNNTIEGKEALRIVGGVFQARYQVKGLTQFNNDEYVAKFRNTIVNASFDHENLTGIFIVNKSQMLKKICVHQNAFPQIEGWGSLGVYTDNYTPSNTAVIPSGTYDQETHRITIDQEYLPNIIIKDFAGYISIRAKIQYDFVDNNDTGTQFTISTPPQRLGKPSDGEYKFRYITWFGTIEFILKAESNYTTVSYIPRYFDGSYITDELRVAVNVITFE